MDETTNNPHNTESEKWSGVVDDSPHIKRLKIILLLIAVAVIAGGIYFLMQQTPPEQVIHLQIQTEPRSLPSDDILTEERAVGDLGEHEEIENFGENETRDIFRNRNDVAIARGLYYNRYYDLYFFENYKIPGVDPFTFQKIEGRWTKDRNSVYFLGEKVPSVNPETFSVISGAYGRDKNNIYYSSKNIVDADAPSFVVLDFGYAKDDNKVYYGSEVLANADPHSFVVLNEQYAKDNRRVYHAGKEVADADAPSFVLLKNEYKKDRHRVYYRTEVVADADAPSFMVLDFGYAKDRHRVYYEGEVVAGADPNSFVFVLLPQRYVYETSRRVSHEPISAFADPLVLFSGYARDKTHVFYRGKALEIEIDPASVAVYANLIKDNRRVYQGAEYPYRDTQSNYRVLEGVDASTLEYVGVCALYKGFTGLYFKDKYRLFMYNVEHNYNGLEPVSQVDLSSFRPLGEYDYDYSFLPGSFLYAKDNRRVYFSCRLVEGADADTFTLLGRGYAKDKANVWHEENHIEAADVATFHVLEFEDGSSEAIDEYMRQHGVDDRDYKYYTDFARDKNNLYGDSAVIKTLYP